MNMPAFDYHKEYESIFDRASAYKTAADSISLQAERIRERRGHSTITQKLFSDATMFYEHALDLIDPRYRAFVTSEENQDHHVRAEFFQALNLDEKTQDLVIRTFSSLAQNHLALAAHDTTVEHLYRAYDFSNEAYGITGSAEAKELLDTVIHRIIQEMKQQSYSGTR